MTRKNKFSRGHAVRLAHNGGHIGKVEDHRYYPKSRFGHGHVYLVYFPGHGRFVITEDGLEPHG